MFLDLDLLASVIRDAAIGTAVDALDAYVIRGVTHNIPLLRYQVRVMRIRFETLI